MTAPASIAASCGVDALIHAMEAYVSRNATPFSDAMAEKAMGNSKMQGVSPLSGLLETGQPARTKRRPVP